MTGATLYTPPLTTAEVCTVCLRLIYVIETAFIQFSLIKENIYIQQDNTCIVHNSFDKVALTKRISNTLLRGIKLLS